MTGHVMFDFENVYRFSCFCFFLGSLADPARWKYRSHKDGH